MKTLFVRFRNFIAPSIAYFLISLISRTLNMEFINSDIVKNIKKDGKKIVYAFWHGRQFLTVYAHRNKKIAILTSLSKDGDLQTAILSRFGYKCLRGSSSKGGMQALRDMIRAVRDGYACAFAVDGPKGPIYKVKPGAVYLARLSNAVIVPVACSAKKAKIFEKAWDKYVLPLPFSAARIIYGSPISVEKDDDIEKKCLEVENSLINLTKEADLWN